MIIINNNNNNRNTCLDTNDPEMTLKAGGPRLPGQHHTRAVPRQYIKINDAPENKSVDHKAQF